MLNIAYYQGSKHESSQSKHAIEIIIRQTRLALKSGYDHAEPMGLDRLVLILCSCLG